MLLNGCNKKINYDLPNNLIVFLDTKEIDRYVSFSYNDRIYIPYGAISGSIDGNDVQECIGYYVQDDNDDGNRICTLANDTDNNYLMNYYIDGEMEQPVCYRAIDKKDKDIEIPDFVDSVNYDYWQ